ncbi:MAG TPA: four helix bundle protein [Opitutaceae bacterium]|nr:four helix bundle protein [Opitutaceae bacterium]
MATFKRFEDIEAWQRAREITRRIYALSNDGPFLRDHGLRDQVRRAAVSVMANIAEGFGRGGNREFSQFLGHARGSLAELKSHLYVALDAGFIGEQVLNELLALCSQTEAQISGLINYLSTSEKRGPRLRAASP